MADSWSTTVSDWQGVDDEPKSFSHNIVESDGIKKSIIDVVMPLGEVLTTSSAMSETDRGTKPSMKVRLKKGVTYIIDVIVNNASENTNFVIRTSTETSSAIAYNINSNRTFDYTPSQDIENFYFACYNSGCDVTVSVRNKQNLIGIFKTSSVLLPNVYDLNNKTAVVFAEENKNKGLRANGNIDTLNGYCVSEILTAGIVLIDCEQLSKYNNWANYVLFDDNGNIIKTDTFPSSTFALYIPVGYTARICTSISRSINCYFGLYSSINSSNNMLKFALSQEEKLTEEITRIKNIIYDTISFLDLTEISRGNGYVDSQTEVHYGNFGTHVLFNISGKNWLKLRVNNGIATYEGYKFLFTNDEDIVLGYLTGADLPMGNVYYMFNIPIGTTKFYASELGSGTTKIQVDNIKLPLNNVKISWYGTSIPAQGYPQIIGTMLGAIVTNEAQGSSAARRGAYAYAPGTSYTNDPCKVKGLPWPVPVYGLMKSSVELDEIITNWTNYVDTWAGTYEGEQGAPTNAKPHDINDGQHEALKSTLRNLCFDVKVARHCGINHPYNTGAVDVSDIYVIEHAYNDIQGIFYDVSSNYNTIPDDPYDKNTPIGALNALIKYIYEHNSKAIILLIGHYECQLSTGVASKSVIEKVAEYWSIPLLKLYDLTGINQRNITTNGYWDSSSVWQETGFTFTTDGEDWTSNNLALSYGMVAGSYAGTYSGGVVTGTNATALKARLGITEGDGDATWKPTRQMMMLIDNLHPKSAKTIQYFARIIANWISSIYSEM